jgi:hypothetical protein
MAKIEQWTANGDKLTRRTNDQDEIRKAENEPFRDGSNITRTQVTEIK